MGIVDFLDEDGRWKRVYIPENQLGMVPPEEGIPVSLDISGLYAGVPGEFVTRVSNDLWNVGLIEPKDFLKPGAADKIRAALLSAIRSDTMDIIALAKETK